MSDHEESASSLLPLASKVKAIATILRLGGASTNIREMANMVLPDVLDAMTRRFYESTPVTPDQAKGDPWGGKGWSSVRQKTNLSFDGRKLKGHLESAYKLLRTLASQNSPLDARDAADRLEQIATEIQSSAPSFDDLPDMIRRLESAVNPLAAFGATLAALHESVMELCELHRVRAPAAERQEKFRTVDACFDRLRAIANNNPVTAIMPDDRFQTTPSQWVHRTVIAAHHVRRIAERMASDEDQSDLQGLISHYCGDLSPRMYELQQLEIVGRMDDTPTQQAAANATQAPDGYYAPTQIATAINMPDNSDAIRMKLKRLLDDGRLPDGAWMENNNPAKGQAKILYKLSIVRPLLTSS